MSIMGFLSSMLMGTGFLLLVVGVGIALGKLGIFLRKYVGENISILIIASLMAGILVFAMRGFP